MIQSFSRSSLSRSLRKFLISGSALKPSCNIQSRATKMSPPASNTDPPKASKNAQGGSAKMKLEGKSIIAALLLAALTSLPAVAQEKGAKEKGGEQAKAKAEKVSGDIGLLDTEKNYMIVVTKEGKLVTVDFNSKTKAQEIKQTKVKMAEVGLGSSASVEYVTKGDKNFLTKMEFRPAKGE